MSILSELDKLQAEVACRVPMGIDSVVASESFSEFRQRMKELVDRLESLPRQKVILSQFTAYADTDENGPFVLHSDVANLISELKGE